MKIRSRPNRAMPRHPLQAGLARVLAVLVLSSIAATAIACGGSGARTTTGPSAGPDTSTLAGTWKGTVSAASAAMIAYGSLSITDFRGFKHFGVIGGQR